MNLNSKNNMKIMLHCKKSILPTMKILRIENYSSYEVVWVINSCIEIWTLHYFKIFTCIAKKINFDNFQTKCFFLF